MAETVRLTVQLRDHNNTRRFTQHLDVPLNEVQKEAAECLREMSQSFRRRKREEVKAGE